MDTSTTWHLFPLPSAIWAVHSPGLIDIYFTFLSTFWQPAITFSSVSNLMSCLFVPTFTSSQTWYFYKPECDHIYTYVHAYIHLCAIVSSIYLYGKLKLRTLIGCSRMPFQQLKTIPLYLHKKKEIWGFSQFWFSFFCFFSLHFNFFFRSCHVIRFMVFVRQKFNHLVR